MQSKATTVRQYLDELPEERRSAIEAVRKVILANLGEGYEEGMQYGMIGYYVPHRLYPAGYHADPKQPLPFVALASQKNAMSLYLGVYAESTLDTWFRSAWKKTGKKLDMGKSCIRFKRVDNLALDVIAEAVRRMPLDAFVRMYETSLIESKGGRRVDAARSKSRAKAKRPALRSARSKSTSRSR
jgi:hypothetical protein